MIMHILEILMTGFVIIKTAVSILFSASIMWNKLKKFHPVKRVQSIVQKLR